MVARNDIITCDLRKNGDSWYLLITSEFLDYLNLREDEPKTCVLKLDHGKWGNFIGVGKARK